MRLENNIVYENINKLVFFNPSSGCEVNGSYSTTSTAYGCGGQTQIKDGSGVYITRNKYLQADTNGANPNKYSYVGSFVFTNNIAWGNGMNGLVVHKTDNTLVSNNTIYKNGEVPSREDLDSSGNAIWVFSNGQYYNVSYYFKNGCY